MRRQPGTPVIPALGICAWLLVVACTGAEPRPAVQPRGQPSNIPNPAARKCVEDGYELEPVLAADGLPIDHYCVDKASGKRCEVWDYFRGDCRLREAPQR